MKNKIYILFVFLSLNGLTQNPIPPKGNLFKDDVVARVDITVDPADLNFMYANVESNTEHDATFIFDNGTVRDTVTNVGFRLRGNTSRNSAKKSFKVSFNTFTTGGKYKGVEKLNLNGEHNDPSIMRSKLCWDLLRKMEIPAPRSSYVKLYINGSYYGLYINVEHIDDEFVQNRFGNDDGNLYKCTYPADLAYLGTNPNSYKVENWGRRQYELQTNKTIDDYTDIRDFITILTQEPISNLPCALEEVFNVDAYLKVIAFDILTSNWDGPIWNKNNFYLYKNTATNKFEYIPFDLDNTFGISWFSNINWTTRNIYNWSHDNEARPIYDRILAVPAYKDRFSYYMNELLQTLWNDAAWFAEIDQIKALITPDAIADTYRTLDYGFTVNDFNNSLTQAFPNHVPHGIKTFITARRNSALNQVVVNDIEPVISDINTALSIINNDVVFTVKVFDDQPNVTVELYYSEDGGAYQTVILYDDGMHQDEAANDGIYGNIITPTITQGDIDYYIKATDNQAKEVRRPCTDARLVYNTIPPKLVINEFMASNNITVTDEEGEYDDWIEIYNAGNTPIYLGDKYLTDNLNVPNKWQMPDVSIDPDTYYIIWADEDGSQGENHANFKLSKGGESIGIFGNESTGYLPIDLVDYAAQTTDISYGRMPNGTGAFQVLDSVTFNQNNEGGAIIVVEPPIQNMSVYPNPFTTSLNIEHPFDENPTLFVFNSLGQKVYTETNIAPRSFWNGVDDRGQALPSGIYTLVFMIPTEDKVEIEEKQKILIVR